MVLIRPHVWTRHSRESGSAFQQRQRVNPGPLLGENRKSLGPRLRGDDDFIIQLLKAR